MMRKTMIVLAFALVLAAGSVGWAAAQEAAQGAAQGAETENQNPVAAYLAGLTGMSYEEVVDLQKDGNGLGNIGRAYLFSEATGIPLEEVLAMAKDSGWGNLYKEYDLHPGGNGLGSLIRGNNPNANGNGNPFADGDSEKPGGGNPDKGKPSWANGPKNDTDD